MFSLLLLCCWLGLAPAAAQGQADPAVLRAQLHQELLPSLGARAQAAQARTEAAERWYGGEGAWSEAFPALASAPLGDPDFLRAQAWQLQLRAQQRADQQAATAPAGLELVAPALLANWREALGEACEAEERADLLEQRFVAGLRAALVRAPGLADSAVEEQLSAWASLRAALPDDDPSSDQLALAAAAGQVAGELEALRQLAWRAATVPGDSALALAVTAQLEPLPVVPPEDPVAALLLDARVDRLERVAPLLPQQLAAQVLQLVSDHGELELSAEKARLEAALAAEAEAQAPVEELPVEQLEEQVRQLHSALELARHDLGSELHEAGQDGLRQEVAQLRVWLDEKRLATRQAALERALRLATTGLEHDQSGSKAVAARREADLARQRADADAERASQAESALRERVVQQRQEIADLVEAEGARREASIASIDALSLRLETQSDGLRLALALPPLDPQRQLRIDDAYLALRALVDDTRRDLGQRVDVLAELQADSSQRLSLLDQQAPVLDDGVSSELIRELRNDAQGARADIEIALGDREQAAADEIRVVLGLLGAAKVRRRVGRDEASAHARREVSRAFLPELVEELTELPVRAGSRLRQSGPWLRSLPAKLQDLGAIWLLLAGSVELLLLALVWLWLRRAAPRWTERLLLSARDAAQDRDARGLPRWLALQAQRWLEPGDIGGLAPPWTTLVTALVDALAAWQLARAISDGPVVIALSAWAFAALVLWRGLPSVVGALLASPEDERPALRLVTPATSERVLWTARLLLGWWLLLVLCQLATLRLLDADRLLELVNLMGSLAFWVLVLVIVHRWSGALVVALGERPDSRLVRWAGHHTGSWLLTTLQGATALGLLLAQQAARLAARVAGGGPSMSRLAALVARRQLRESSERQGEPLDDAIAEKLMALRPPLPGIEALHGELEVALATWFDHRRRGLHVVTGDRGLGRTTTLQRLGRSLAGDHKVISFCVEHRIDSPDEARAWLAARVLGRSSETAPGRQELIDEISLLPGPRVFLVDDMERLFLREVGGFAALRATLQVLHATSDEHFWICGFHGPTWAYLRGVPGVFDPAFFERVHPLPLAGPDALARWLGTAAQQADLELSFDDLAGIGPNTLEADRLRTRAQAAFWRLLADASAGNPQVARALWIAGSRLDGETLRVGLFEAPVATRLQDLTDNELFVLTAVVVHDRLTVDQLARALNLPRSGVRTACQRLVARGVLASDGFDETSQYSLELPWLPAVERHLRNKNFLAGR